MGVSLTLAWTELSNFMSIKSSPKPHLLPCILKKETSSNSCHIHDINSLYSCQFG